MSLKHGIPWLNVCDCPGKSHQPECKAPRGMTWNPVRGCTKTDPGCKNCYAIVDAARMVRIGRGPTASAKQRAAGASYAECLVDKEGSPRNNWNGHVELVPEFLDRPLRWKHPRTIFGNSMSDLFHSEVPFAFIAAVFAVAAATPRHRYVFLTKRPERAIEWFAWLDAHVGTSWSAERNERISYVLQQALAATADIVLPGVVGAVTWPLPNVTIGVSISDQTTADRLLPLLAQIPAATRVVSAEPLLDSVDLYIDCEDYDGYGGNGGFTLDQFGNADMKPCDSCAGRGRVIPWEWVIIGAESGLDRRPCDIKHVQNLGKQVLDAQVWDTPQGPPGPRQHGAPMLVSGPALFVKQLDVCKLCHGGTAHIPGECPGQTGKLRKDCPALHIPGHGAQQWRQFPVGWRS